MNLQEIRNIIAQGDTKGAIQALSNLAKESAWRNKRLQNDLLILSNRFEEIRHREIIGLMNQDDVMRENAQVANALLHLLGEMESGASERREEDSAPFALAKQRYSTRTRQILTGSGMIVGVVVVACLIIILPKDENMNGKSKMEVVEPRPFQDSIIEKNTLSVRSGQLPNEQNTFVKPAIGKPSSQQPLEAMPKKEEEKTGKEPETITEKNTSPATTSLYYFVKVVVDAGETENGNLLVDGLPCDIIEFTATVKKIRVKRKDTTHLFEWQTGSRTCRKVALITGDNQQVTIPCSFN